MVSCYFPAVVECVAYLRYLLVTCRLPTYLPNLGSTYSMQYA